MLLVSRTLSDWRRLQGPQSGTEVSLSRCLVWRHWVSLSMVIRDRDRGQLAFDVPHVLGGTVSEDRALDSQGLVCLSSTDQNYCLLYEEYSLLMSMVLAACVHVVSHWVASVEMQVSYALS